MYLLNNVKGNHMKTPYIHKYPLNLCFLQFWTILAVLATTSTSIAIEDQLDMGIRYFKMLRRTELLVFDKPLQALQVKGQVSPHTLQSLAQGRV